jgi:class 3 adenylate cyclase
MITGPLLWHGRCIDDHGGTGEDDAGVENSSTDHETAIRDVAREIGIEVRVGIHTGEVERRTTELSGIAVHLAHRVCGAAQPGEVLVSRTVVDLVAGSGIALDDRGGHELEGVPAAWRRFAVTT